MNLKKLLGKLFLSSFLLGVSFGVFQCSSLPLKTDGLSKIHIPRAYKNYRRKDKHPYNEIVKFGNYLYNSRNYDIDSDGDVDVSELYLLGSSYKEPILYGFDFDNNHNVLDSNEILIDINMDGLNHNEIWMKDYIGKKEKEEKERSVKQLEI